MSNNNRVQIEFGKKIQQLRVGKGMSQEDLAARSGLHRTYISSIERGQRNPSLVNLHKLADALELSLSRLFS